MTTSPYGRRVEEHGLGGSHRRILDEIAGGTRVLDIGCATGYLASHVSARGCSVVGFERDHASASLAERHCEQVIVGDIESRDDRDRLPRGFDFVVLGDVLEHLVDPWETLAFTRELLSGTGVVIASVPNVAAWPVRLGLLVGSFEYAETGLLDRTHLRFFTRASARELVTRAGFTIERERFVHLERPPGPIRGSLPLATSLVDRMLARTLPGLFAQQFVFRLRPRTGP